LTVRECPKPYGGSLATSDGGEKYGNMKWSGAKDRASTEVMVAGN